MNSWIMVMWIISSLMACWSFSLFIRLISEIVAQNQNQMVAKKSTRSLWIGFVLIFICGATSVFAARAAIHVENTFGGGLTRWSTPIALVCGTAGLFGICMFIWAWVGDRPRGRTRCPKCWYDMSAATGLLCPECGRTAKSTKKFSKTRRPKWAFVVALFFFIVGGYGFSVSKRVAENDWLAAVPSWFLMLGWEHLPEDWIFEDNSPYFSTLDTRFDDSWRDYAWISDSRSRRFGRKLCRGFLDSKEARWDPGRVLLLDAIGQERILYKNANDDDKRKWTGPPIDSTELLQRSTDYLIDAVLKNNPSTLELQNIDNTFNTYTIAKEWIQETLDQQDENQTDYDGESYWQNWELNRLNFQSHLSKQFSQQQRDRIVADQFKKMFVSTDLEQQLVTTTLVYDMHMLEHFFDVLLDPKPDSNKISPHRRSIYLGILSDTFSPKELNRLFDELNTLLDNDGDENVALVLSTLGSIQRVHELNENNSNEQYQQLFNNVLVRAIDNHELMYPNDEFAQSKYHTEGLNLLALHDVDGDQSYPLVLQQLLKDASEAPYLQNSYNSLGSNEHIKLWIMNFGPLVEMNDPDINTWLINNLPVQLGTEYDDQLDQIAVHFLDDPDEEIRESARYRLEERLADILITH